MEIPFTNLILSFIVSLTNQQHPRLSRDIIPMILLRFTHLPSLHSRDKRIRRQEELEGPLQDLSRMDLYLEAS